MQDKGKQSKTVQEEWMGTTSEEDKQKDAVVVREFACGFD